MNLNFFHCVGSKVLMLQSSCCVHLSLLCLFVFAALDYVKHWTVVCSVLIFAEYSVILLPVCKLHWTQQIGLLVTNGYVKMTCIFGRKKALDKVIQEFAFFTY